MTTLVFARHGQTDANAGGLLLGRADPPLNERGRGPGRHAGGRRSRPGRGRPRSSRARSLRTRETAAAIGAACDVSVEVEDRLIEVDYGEFDGHPFGELPLDVVVRWRTDPHFAPPGGESLAAVSGAHAPSARAELLGTRCRRRARSSR